MINEFIEKVLQDWRVPGAAVAIVENGVITSTNYFGHAKAGIPVTEKTLFAVGSTSKAFTATLAVMASKSSSSLDKTYVSLGADGNSKQVSLHELLTHTSGIAPHDVAWFGGGRSRAEVLTAAKKDGLGLNLETCNSGTFQYSNIGYGLAANVLEQETNQTFEELVTERILKPLEMTSSGCDTSKISSSETAARPHILTQKDEVVELESYHNTEVVAPAGGLYSTLDDMTKWLLANLGVGKSVLSKEVLDELHSTHTTPESKAGVPFLDPLWANEEVDKPVGYGYGWFTYGYRGERVVEHGGNIDGFSCIISMMPEKKSGVIILTNLQGFPFHLAHNVIAYGIYDRTVFQNAAPVDWNTRALDFSKMVQQGMKGMIGGTAGKVRRTEQEQVDALSGRYHNALYGDIIVQPNSKGFGLELMLHGRKYDFLALESDSTGLENNNNSYWMVDDVLFPTGFVFTANTEQGHLSATMEATAAPIIFKKQGK